MKILISNNRVFLTANFYVIFELFSNANRKFLKKIITLNRHT